MSTQEEIERKAELNIWAMAAPAVRQLLEKRKKIALDVMMRDFRMSGVTNVGHVAIVSVLDELERDIGQKENEYFSLRDKQNKEKI